MSHTKHKRKNNGLLITSLIFGTLSTFTLIAFIMMLSVGLIRLATAGDPLLLTFDYGAAVGSIGLIAGTAFFLEWLFVFIMGTLKAHKNAEHNQEVMFESAANQFLLKIEDKLRTK